VLVAGYSAPLVARFGSIALAIGLVPLLIVATVGWTHFDPAIFRASWNMTGGSDASALVSATLLLFMAYLGLENASILSDLMENPSRNVPIATIAGILFTTVIYVASTTVVSGLIPAADLARSSAPFADAAAIFLGATAALLVAVCGAIKASGTLGAIQLGTVESLLVLKRQTTGSSMSRTATNIVVGLLATVLAIVTSSPSAASQFSVLATALVTLAIISYMLGAAALVKMQAGRPRVVGIACLLFLGGLLAAQPLTDLRNALLMVIATMIVAAAIVAWRRRIPIRPA
jgi:arginine:agmatine antiporter